MPTGTSRLHDPQSAISNGDSEKLRLFSSESVCEGHPDKVADQISDAVLDRIMATDPDGRVACETLVTTGLALVAGEITTTASLNIPEIVRDTIVGIGYDSVAYGIDGRSCAVLVAIDRQSLDISQGVDTGGAGDQGMMFGFATDETEELLPAPIVFAHRLTRALAAARRSGAIAWLRPDGKSQVTVAYDGDRPAQVTAVVLSAQHDPDVLIEEIRETLLEEVIVPALPPELFDPSSAAIHVNPTGRFVTGGPQGDVGLTGRKIIVDTYGGMGRHGGGAFSGKDPTKVDRSAAYAARWAAKHVVAAGLARRCEIQLAYAIGVAEPVSVWVDTFGTGTVPDDHLSRALGSVFDFRPATIILDLGLRNPIFGPTAVYGHFGRVPEAARWEGREIHLFPWERTDRVSDLLAAVEGAG
ncbi:MAG: methionine adenosyltransferase [Gemmatimonadetes bacterium]|nr:methionine adenosyltransferase [Gemmatimonadota bacterium]